MGNLRVSGDATPSACHDFIIDYTRFSVQFPAPLWQTKAIMLIEIWERLRDYDKWIQADATIKSSTVERIIRIRKGRPVPRWIATNMIVWNDLHGQQQSAVFHVPNSSPLYQFIGGETVTIRYNPINHEQFYYRDLLRSSVRSGVQMAILILIFAGVLFLIDLPSLLIHK